jgi:hypothetical protein
MGAALVFVAGRDVQVAPVQRQAAGTDAIRAQLEEIACLVE